MKMNEKIRNGVIVILIASSLTTFFFIERDSTYLVENTFIPVQSGSQCPNPSNGDFISFQKYEKLIEVLQRNRKNRILEKCNGYGAKIPLNIKKLDHLLVDDKHKLIYCYVPKVACTNWKRVLYILQEGVNTNMTDVPANLVHHFNNFKALSTFDPKAVKYRLDKYYKFMFAREPLERVLSAYMNKFKNVYSDTFQKRYGRDIIRRYRQHPSSESLTKGHDVSFTEFVRYLSDPKTQLSPGFNEHWERYHKLCLPCQINYDYIGLLETVDEDTEYILRKNNVSHLVSLNSSPKSGRTAELMTSYYSDMAPELVKKLVDVYSFDYDLFGYKKPSY